MWLVRAEEEDGLREDRSVEEGDAMHAVEEVGEEVGEAEDDGDAWPCIFMFWGTSRRPRWAMLLFRFGLRSLWAVAASARRVVARMCLRYILWIWIWLLR